MAIFNRDSEDEVARGARAVVVHAETHGGDRRDSDARLEEAHGLALAIGIDVRAAQSFRVRDRKPATLFGSGQVEHIATLVNQEEAELVISLLRQILTEFLTKDDVQEPARLVLLEGGNSPNLRAKSRDNPSVRPKNK